MRQVNGGTISDQVDWAADKLESQFPVSSVFAQDEMIDIVGVTKGRGFKGALLSACFVPCFSTAHKFAIGGYSCHFDDQGHVDG